MNFRIISSEKGRKLLVINGHKFSFQKLLAGGLKRWICTSRKTTCRAYVKTDDQDNFIIDSVLDHNHDSLVTPISVLKKRQLSGKFDSRFEDSNPKQNQEFYNNSVPQLKPNRENSDTSEEKDESYKQHQKTIDKPSKRPLILIHRKRPATENTPEQVDIPIKKRGPDQLSREETHINHLNRTQKLEENDDEDAYIFGMGVAAKVKKLKNERLKIRVQRDIDMLLYDAIMETGPYSSIEEVDIKEEHLDDIGRHEEKILDQSNLCDEVDIKIEDTEIL